MRGAYPRVIAAALAMPAVILLAATALLLLAVPFGYRAFAAPANLTMSEAAILRDQAEVLRQLQHGVDPHALQSIREGIIADDIFTMTPFEAAIAGRHLEVLELLVRNGAAVSDHEARRLICLSRAKEAPEITTFLEQHSPSSVPADCHDVRPPW